jgi:very-short-patch-repair endonuclease
MKPHLGEMIFQALQPWLPWFLGIAIVLAVLKYLASRLERRSKGSKTDLYEPIPYLLSESEKKFHEVLYDAVGQRYLIYPKVGLSDIVDVRKRLARSDSQAAWNRINQKHVDFILCSPGDYRVLAVIELDDKSHGDPRRQDRDLFVDEVLKTVGLPILHVKAARDYDPQQLADSVATLLGS